MCFAGKFVNSTEIPRIISEDITKSYPGCASGAVSYTHLDVYKRQVQANLYLCGDTLIGGDVVATGKGGFQHGLTYPAV